MNPLEQIRNAKKQAFENLKSCTVLSTFDLFADEIRKIPGAGDHVAIHLGHALIMNDELTSIHDLRNFINDRF